MFRPVLNIFFCSKKIFGGRQSKRSNTGWNSAEGDCLTQVTPKGTHGVRDVVSDSFSKHRRGEPGVDVLRVQVVILAVEHERGGVAAQQVGEGAANHGETEHWPVLRTDRRR